MFPSKSQSPIHQLWSPCLPCHELQTQSLRNAACTPAGHGNFRRSSFGQGKPGTMPPMGGIMPCIHKCKSSQHSTVCLSAPSANTSHFCTPSCHAFTTANHHHSTPPRQKNQPLMQTFRRWTSTALPPAHLSPSFLVQHQQATGCHVPPEDLDFDHVMGCTVLPETLYLTALY